jgi:predicted nucleic acid-binding protein
VIFLDASVLVAVAQVRHERHAASRELWNQCEREKAATSVQTVAELYNALTTPPPPFRVRSRDAVLALETFLARITTISLAGNEYMTVLARAAQMELSGAALYDALHLACARKCGADKIYTLNVQQYQTAAPDLAPRIRMP